MQPERYQKILDLLANLPTSDGRSFFAAHGLEGAWSRPSRGWGRRERVNEALAEAERRGILAQILDSAELQFSGRSGVQGNRHRKFTGQSGIEWTADLNDPLGPPGGFGHVYAGQGSEGNEVAIKIVPLRAGGEAERERRKREVDIAALLHEIDASYLVVPADYAFNGDDLLIVMPRAKAALSDWLGRLDEKGQRKALLDVARGLQELAQVSILHRDLKPGNVLLCDDRWKLSDFGIARDAMESTATFTWRGYGTLAYMAPELWELKSATVQTDLYAFGCLAYEVLTGRRPFTGPDQDGFREQHLRQPPPPLPNVDPGLARLVLRLLSKDPMDRHQDARAVVEELQGLNTPLNERQKRLRRLAAAAEQDRAAREADQRRQLESLELAEARRRQALSDLGAVMNTARDFIRDALPDATVTGDDAMWQVRLQQARLSIVPWPQPPKPADSRDHIVLAGEIRGVSSRNADLGLLGNIVYEEDEGRLEWRLYRFAAPQDAGPGIGGLEKRSIYERPWPGSQRDNNLIYDPKYDFRPELGKHRIVIPVKRAYGLTSSTFDEQRVDMVREKPIIRIEKWKLQRMPFNADALADLLEETLID